MDEKATHLLSCLFRRASMRSVPMMAGLIATAGSAAATDLTVRLQGTPSISRQVVQYTCDASGSKIGVPESPFSAEYINAGGNSLVVVPILGKSLIFANVVSGSGARYVARQYTWWEAGGGVMLSSESLAGKMNSTCRRVGR
jgi:membrane-bound inhibitor of C-type lysozyme